MKRARAPLILHLQQDDPRKCSARKMDRMGMAKVVRHMDEVPFGSLLLDPFSEKALSPEDRGIFRKKGIVAVDCSWEEAERVIPRIRRRHRLHGRALPMLLAANPVNHGKWGKLTTLEALSASYIILGEREAGEEMLTIYNWGFRFLELNMEPLKAYAGCGNSSEIVEIQKEFF